MEDGSSVLISDYLITNRDYLTYVMWCADLHGDYPEVSYLAMLGENYLVECRELFPECGKIEDDSLFKCKKPYLVDYLLNPNFLDYPVVNLSWQQIFRFNNWLRDRYNEYYLIKQGQLTIKKEPGYDHCFVTEAYIHEQYVFPGYEEAKVIEWSEKMMLPSFRLPTKAELGAAKTEGKAIQNLTMKREKLEFLAPWYSMYIKYVGKDVFLNDYQRLFTRDYMLKMKIPNKAVDIGKLKFKELTLDLDSQISVIDAFAKQGYFINDVEKYFDNYGYLDEKDSLGRMDFIIIDETAEGKPILLDNNIPKTFKPASLNPSGLKHVAGTNKLETLNVFRFAATMRPNQYKN
jgi:hypothetical protein